MRWPWSREKRQESSFTDALVRTIVEQHSGKALAVPAATGALEGCASIVARCFAAAKVEAPGPQAAALSPACLSLIGRALIRQGEFVAGIEVRDGRVLLAPAASWDVRGFHEPDTWVYRLTLAGPRKLTTLDPVASEGVVHVRYQADPENPWRGVGPLQSAAIAGKLSAEVMQALADEASGPRGYLLPIPVDGEDTTVETLKSDIRKLQGSVALVESQAAGWDASAPGSAPRGDWDPKRIGANPPAAAVQLAELAAVQVYTACGIPPTLFSERSDGTARREAYRQLLHGTISPLGRIAETELSEKLETEVRLNFDSLFAADLSGRARAFQSLVGGGMDPAKAAGLAGLMADE